MEAMERARLWASDSYFDKDTRAQAAAVQREEQALMTAFGSELRFGTGGLRGIVGVGTARMNRYTVARATLGLARYLKRGGAGAGVVIAHDSRHGSREFAAVAAGVLACEGIQAYVFPQLAPTPMLSYAVRALKLDAGVMITASHNPAEYNGYKVYGADGCQITDHAAQAITDEICAVGYTDARILSEAEARRAHKWLDVEDSVRRSFAQACLFCRPDPTVCSAVHVVYTPLHGTGLLPVREVLSRMQGVTVTEVTAQCEPDGDFPTCPKPNPELDETLELGLKLANETHADLLLATDPDCDRVGVAVRKPDGSYLRLSGNEVGLLLLEYILRVRRSQGTLPAHAVAVKTIVTSDLAFAIARAYGVSITEVLTGFKYIGEVIGRLEADGRENDFVFGFEESCGYLAGTHVRDKDGVMACMLVCEMAQACHARGSTIYQELQALYARYGYTGTALMSFDIAGALPMRRMAATMRRLREHPLTALAGSPVLKVTDYLDGASGLPSSDVLAFEAEQVKAIIRLSGTEPKVKVYLSAKAASRPVAEALLDALRAEMRGAVLA
ncbi:MAG: phospho-sugar mutase [Clostridiales bacterium]|nr:phospho-sugar mutase [Clostridiales bacterium]